MKRLAIIAVIFASFGLFGCNNESKVFKSQRNTEFEIRNSISYLSNSNNPQDSYIAGLRLISLGDSEGARRMADKLNNARDYIAEEYLRQAIKQGKK